MPSLGQEYDRNERVTVFTDSANVRENASVSSKILTSLRHGTNTIVCASGYITDTINGNFGRWIPVLHNSISGYMWQSTLADITETHKNGNTLLARNTKTGISYKIIRGKQIVNQGSFIDSARQRYSGLLKMQLDKTIEGSYHFRVSYSPKLYAFDGEQVYPDGECNLKQINEFHPTVTKEFTDSLGVVILNNDVHLRIAPNVKSQLLATIPQYNFVAPTKAIPFKDTVNEELDFWHRVIWQGQTGFVLGSALGIKINHIYDDKDTNFTYLLTEKAILVLKNRKPIAHASVNWHSYDNKLHSFGDMGFGVGYNFVALEFVAHSCGQTGGDMFYLWDGKSIKYFCFDSGTGDGSYSDYSSYIFPNNHNLGPKTIIHHTSSSEGIRIIPANNCESNDIQLDDYEYTSVMQFIDDTLVEIDSKYLRARQFVEQQLPQQNAIRIMFADINSDGNDDLIFQAINESENQEYYDYGSINELENTTIGIAFGTDNNGFEMKFLNSKLVEGRMDKRIQWLYKDGTLTLHAYYISRESRHDRYPSYSRKKYQFEYDSKDQAFYWKNVTVIDENGINSNAFKTKKIRFENAWPYEVIDNGY